jgi:transposase
MIIPFGVNINNYDEIVLNFYGIWEYTCPCCGAKMSFNRHAQYSRNICMFKIDKLETIIFTVLRLICKSCKTTHAILPSGTIPYSFYSFSSVLMILSKHFIEETPVIEISKKFNISIQMIYPDLHLLGCDFYTFAYPHNP